MPIIIDYAVEVRPIAVSSLIYRAGLLLQDEEHVRWTTLELIEWINEAAGALVTLRPSAGARLAVLTLLAGTQQELSDEVVQLLDVVRNLGVDSLTPGRAIRLAERHLFDSADPDWHARAGKSVIKHYIYDDRTPKVFYVYPPALAGTKLQASLSVMPALVTTEDDNLGLGAQFESAIINYVVFRAMAKDSEYANGAIATGYYQAFQAALGGKDAGEQSVSPNTKVPA
jgi:hypothetical protein